MDTENPQVNLLAKELKEHGIACSFDEAEKKAHSIIMATENKKTEDEKIQLLGQRYKFLLNSQNKKFTEEINNLKKNLDSVSSDLIELKRKFNEQKQEIKINQQEKPKETQQKIKQVEEIKELKPGDISIEKFFYCGQKD